jgi:hypothetical protein
MFDENLRNVWEADGDAGVLRWKIKVRNINVGDIAGSVDSQTGYRKVAYNGKKYYVHRLIYMMLVGPIPDGYEMDHRNGVRHDNRLVNLRIATKHQNSQNVKKRDGTVHRGVHWENFSKKYKAQITVQNKCINLGRFETIEEAIVARDEAEKLHHGEFSPLLCRAGGDISE